MINYIEATIESLAIHYVGSHSLEEGVRCTENIVPLHSDRLQQLLLGYFFNHFTTPEFYTFESANDEHATNPLFQFAAQIFDQELDFVQLTKNITQHLYEHSVHPNIKSGDLLIAKVKDVLVDDEMIDAICIFKSETKDAFLTLRQETEHYILDENSGINIEKLDKACVIFNTEKSDGYKICAIDKSNRSKEAQFWMEQFLHVKARSDEYYQTSQYIQATTGFIKERMRPLYDLDKAREAEILNRSHDFLKHEEKFDPQVYEREIFKDDKVINEFKNYKNDFQEERNVELADQFSISQAAVKNKSRVFKSVLKLDKNFHVYIHGNRNMIEKGVDDQGRKFYTLYYEDEN